jgi:hypothetical protein
MSKLTNAERAARGITTPDPWPVVKEYHGRYASAAIQAHELGELAVEKEDEGHAKYLSGYNHEAGSALATAAAYYRDLADALNKAAAALWDAPRREQVGF